MVFGPTAVGKSNLISAFAGADGEVVSADAFQVYRYLDVGTAKPTREERRRISYHLIDVVDPDEQFDAGQFVWRAEAALKDIASRGKRSFIVGGCGYYLRMLICGLPSSPRSDPDVRSKLINRLKSEGREVLRRELEHADGRAAGRIHPNDSYRIVRALEVIAVTGQPFSSFLLPTHPIDPGRFQLIGLKRSREDLSQRIDERVEIMRGAGFAQEVKNLLSRGFEEKCPGMRGIGYRELVECGGEPTSEVWDAIKHSTKRYAKRQMTFFRSLPEVTWVDADDQAGVQSLLSVTRRDVS